jgi:hypothetical protein
MFKKILIVLVVAVGGFLAFAATRPDTYHVERSTKIDAPPAVVYSQLENLKAWDAWSPWEKRDPAMKKTYEGPPVGVGSAYSWDGKDVGAGKMTITGTEPPKQLKIRLEFIKPFTATAAVDFKLESAGGKATAVTWAMDGTNDLMGKIFGIFMNMDQAVGSDFEKGLASLKTVAEAEAEKQAAAAKAKAEADAAAAAAVKAQAEAETAAAAAAEAAAKGKAKGKGKK